MRKALILLAVVALIILVAGAFNNGVVFDIDYVAGTASAVSLFWVSLVIAAIVFVVGLAAAWFALAGAAGGRRKLEAELQSTYERLRETERDAEEARSAAAAASASAAAAMPAAPPEATAVAEPERLPSWWPTRRRSSTSKPRRSSSTRRPPPSPARRRPTRSRAHPGRRRNRGRRGRA